MPHPSNPEEVNNRNRKYKMLTFADYILILLLVILIGVIIIGALVFKSDSNKCIKNPLTYGVQQLEKQNNNIVTCMCSKSSSQDKLYVTDNNVSIFKLR